MHMLNQGFFHKSIVVKKSPVVIVKNFIVLQFAAVAVFFIAGILADYGEIYKHLPLSSSLSYHIAQAAGIFIFETLIVFYIFFRWYKEYYDIRNDKVVHGQGLIFRKKTIIPISSIYSIDYRQGPLGRLTKYGHIELKNSFSTKKIIFDNMPDPQMHVELLTHLKNNLKTNQENKSDGAPIEEIISRGEDEKLEFKTSFRWDIHQNKVNKNLERAAMKTIVAFLNSNGGKLIVGVDDLGNVVGLDRDYESLPKPNMDGFQNHFTNVFHTMIGPEFRQFIELSFYKVSDKDCCLIRVASSDRPVYLKDVEHEDFYIRTGNGTTSLRLSEAASYIDSRWKGKLL